MTEKQEKAKEWLRELHPDVRDALIKKCIDSKEKESKRHNEAIR